MPPATGDINLRGGRGQMHHRLRHRARCTGGQGRHRIRIIHSRHPSTQIGKGITIKRFGRNLAEIGIIEKHGHRFGINPALKGQNPVLVKSLAAPGKDQIIDGRIGGACVKGQA